MLMLTPLELLQNPDHVTIIPEPALQYEHWLLQWITYLRDAPSVSTIPSSASRIYMPLNPRSWQDCLASHPKQAVLDGLVQGFRIGFNGSIKSLCSA